jgi:ribonuclease VapC
MIAVDASAVLAILLDEPEADVFRAVLGGAGGAVMSPVNYWEVLVRAHSIGGLQGRAIAESLLEALNIMIASGDAAAARRAAEAFATYGKGSGSGAQLNLGDCFAYALAERESEGLLFKGGDFPKTDVAAAG